MTQSRAAPTKPDCRGEKFYFRLPRCHRIVSDIKRVRNADDVALTEANRCSTGFRILMSNHPKLPGAQPIPPRANSSARQLTEEFMERRKFPRPMPLPEVVEGNGGFTDWAMFEEAVAGQNKAK